MAESYVQVALDGSGKSIRNISVEVLQPDNTLRTVQMQVVSLADQAGRQIDLGNGGQQLVLLQGILDALNALGALYANATQQPWRTVGPLTTQGI
jgi:hypothetical protein